MNQKLKQIADQLNRREPVEPVRVRELLEWFDAKRRGFTIVESIRRALEDSGLETDPDFEEPHIDTEISFRQKRDGEVKQEPAQLEAPSQPRRPLSDPIWRISRLKSANRELVFVGPMDSIQAATTKMLLHDFSQLPVMNGPNNLMGAITWTSIGSKLALGAKPTVARDFMVGAHVLDNQTAILDAIPEIVRHQYVIVKNRQNKVTGIVTTSDLSEEFREQSEPFLVLREIEHQIRKFLIDICGMSPEQIREKVHRGDNGERALPRGISSVHDLSFGDYVTIMRSGSWWEELGLPIDRGEIAGALDEVRKIRNSVVHFDPDTFEGDAQESESRQSVAELRRMNAFLQRLLLAMPTSATADNLGRDGSA